MRWRRRDGRPAEGPADDAPVDTTPPAPRDEGPDDQPAADAPAGRDEPLFADETPVGDDQERDEPLFAADEDLFAPVAGGDAPPAWPEDPTTADAWDGPLTGDPSPEVPVHLGAVDHDARQRAGRRAVARALAEDLGDAGDVTSAATVPALRDGTADVVARADGVVAGLDVFGEVFAQVDPRVSVELRVADGDAVTAGDVLATVAGSLRSILTAERTALNFLCHLSGIATQTRRFVDAVDGTGTSVRDTRKTTPGLRLLEKAAVAAGGGANHRIGLHDALLVKDNHVLAAGSPAHAARTALERSGGRHVQVEVSALDEIDVVLRAGVEDILLDNFTPDEVRLAVRRVAGRARLEASGNVTLDSIRAYAEAGVDRIAVGALTHSAGWLDLALDVQEVAGTDDAAGGPPDEPATVTPRPWAAHEGADLTTEAPRGRFAADPGA